MTPTYNPILGTVTYYWFCIPVKHIYAKVHAFTPFITVFLLTGLTDAKRPRCLDIKLGVANFSRLNYIWCCESRHTSLLGEYLSRNCGNEAEEFDGESVHALVHNDLPTIVMT